MNRTDHWRRSVSLLLAVGILLVVPEVALAKFSSAKAPTLNVQTASLVTPTSIVNDYRCTNQILTEGITVTISGVTDPGQVANARYTFTLLRGATVKDAEGPSTAETAILTGSQIIDLAPTVWTLRVQVSLGSWTSPPYSASITC